MFSREEARYYQDCYAKFASNPPTTKKRGRSEDECCTSAFEELRSLIENSDECQFSFTSMITIINIIVIYTNKKKMTHKYNIDPQMWH